MRNAALPAALVAASLGLALASASWRTLVMSVAVFVAAGTAFALLPTWAPEDIAFFACFAIVLLCGVAVVRSEPIVSHRHVVLAAASGVSTGTAIATSGMPRDLIMTALPVLLAFPAHLVVELRKGIVLKVFASWLAAVSILAATLIVAPITPGYAPDHIE